MPRRSLRGTAAIALAVTLAPLAALAACGGDNAARWTDIDRAFVQEMLPHHHLGMALVDDATLHASDVRLRRLVFEMSGYHSSELHTLERWVAEQRLQPAEQFPGSLSDADLTRLRALDGPPHDIWWLALMIRHHRGAVQIADRTIAGSAVDEVRELAVTVREVQASEILEMAELLRALCADAAEQVPTEGCRTDDA
jgi:hypothetical protein